MDLSGLTKQELIALKMRCNNEIENLEKRIKRRIYIIGSEQGSEHCFKSKEEAIEWLVMKIDEESKHSDSIFLDGDRFIIRTSFIDEIEYDKYADSWIFIQ